MIIKKHISAANKLWEKKPENHALTSAYISGGLCRVGNQHSQYIFPVKIKGEGCIDWPELRSALKAGVTGGNIIMDNNETGFAFLDCNTTEIVLPVTAPHGYPVLEAGELMPAVVLPSNMLLTAHKFISNDKGRNPFNSISFSDGFISASNGYNIYRKPTHLQLLKVMLDARAVSCIQPCGQVTIHVEQTKEHSMLMFEDAFIITKNIEGDHLDYAAIQFDPTYTVHLNRRMLNVAMERVAPVLEGSTNTVTLQITDGKATLSAEDEVSNKKAVVDLGIITENVPDLRRDVYIQTLELGLITNPDECTIAWADNKKRAAVYLNGNIMLGVYESVDDAPTEE